MAGPLRVLIVDDHEDIRRMIPRLLRDSSVDILGEASTGEEAIVWLEEHAVDVVLMDIHMPGIGGIEATRRIKAAHPGTTVFGFTGNGTADMAEMIRAGAAGVFEKTALMDLIDAVRGLQTQAG